MQPSIPVVVMWLADSFYPGNKMSEDVTYLQVIEHNALKKIISTNNLHLIVIVI